MDWNLAVDRTQRKTCTELSSCTAHAVLETQESFNPQWGGDLKSEVTYLVFNYQLKGCGFNPHSPPPTCRHPYSRLTTANPCLLLNDRYLSSLKIHFSIKAPANWLKSKEMDVWQKLSKSNNKLNRWTQGWLWWTLQRDHALTALCVCSRTSCNGLSLCALRLWS